MQIRLTLVENFSFLPNKNPRTGLNFNFLLIFHKPNGIHNKRPGFC